MTTTEYSALPDPFVEDPRGDDYLSPMYTYAGGSMDDAPPDDVLMEAFAKVYRKAYDARWRGRITHTCVDMLAQRVVNRWARVFHPNLARRIYLRSLYGYVQGNWWEVAVSAESEEQATQDAHILEMWLRGDTWYVEGVSVTKCRCDLGGSHEHREVEEAVGGIFAESEEQAIAIFKEGR